MKPKIYKGDLLKSSCDIICHQVNCQGVMGGGIALQIRNKYPEVYEAYKEQCSKYQPSLLMGSALIVKAKDGKYVANLFAQDGFGTDKRYTDYDALQKAFLQVLYEAKKIATFKDDDVSIGIPYFIGCGLAGGSWNIVYKIIDSTFRFTDLTVELWRYDK